ncbi:hypothetical protein QZH41_000641 [Actinostola sp. cb2023]|nr:hypothetical protein QZH41_000641 [Actinostola sp. cb2023]
MAYGNLGIAYRVLGEYQKALEYYEKDLNIAKELGNKLGEGIAYNNLGNAYFSLHFNAKSDYNKDTSDTLLPIQKSERYCRESLQCYESLFDNLGDQDQFKISIVDTFIKTYQLLTAVYIETGEIEQALLVSERKRARALEDILTAKYNLEKKSVLRHHEHFPKYADVERSVLSPDSCILFFSELVSPAGIDESGVGTWVLDLENPVSFCRNELQGVNTLLENEFAVEEHQKNKANIIDTLVDKAYTTMSVRGAVGRENRSLSIHEIAAVGNEAAEGVASSGRDTRGDMRCVYDEELNEDYLEVLYDTFITPVKDKLNHDEIVIIPDGPLFKVPFAALRDPNTKSFLSETKRIRLVPSLTTLKILKESSAESHSMTGALIVGDPDVTGKRMFKHKEMHFNPLPNAKLEAESIGKVLGVTAITGAQATKQAIKQRLREGVAVIHFAAHGCADSGDIVLSPGTTLQEAGKIPEEDDYLLTINEVQEIGLRARLVVLSCCHSGRGEIKSEGVVGMSRAFLAAGALAVVASLWAVDDLATRVFMEKFYGHLRQGKSASTSLQQAMKDMRDTKCYDKPMYWAPFFLIGDDVTINL